MGKREALRNRFGLQEDCNDCVATTFCAACAICQEARELKYRSAPSGGICEYKDLIHIMKYILYNFRTNTSCSTTNGHKYVSTNWTTRNDETRTILSE
jgi:hypothetical protein